MSGEIPLPESVVIHPRSRSNNILLASLVALALSLTGCTILDRFDSNKTRYDYTGIYSGVTRILFWDRYDRFYATATAYLPKTDDPDKYTCPPIGYHMVGKARVGGYLEPGSCKIIQK